MGLTELETEWCEPTQTQMKLHPDAPGDRKGDGVRRYLWSQIIDPDARYFFPHLQEDVADDDQKNIKEWLCQQTEGAKEIMHPERLVELPRPLDTIFAVHLALALMLIEHRGPGEHWVSEGPDPLITKLEGGDAQLMASLRDLAHEFRLPVGLLHDLALELAGGSKRASDRAIIIAPFALVLKRDNAAGGELAQFRFERVPGGQGECYITPEQMFARMDHFFEESVFRSAPKAADRLLEDEEDAHRDCDVRVRIEQFDPTNTRAPFDLFDPEGQGEPPRFFNEELAGRSAGGAAAWGLYFVRTRKHPDPGLIVLALCDECGGLTPVGPKSVAQKVQAIAKSGRFDTIAVVGKKDCEVVMSQLRDLNKANDIQVKNIEED